MTSTLPDVTVNILDNALGLNGQGIDQLFIKLGACSAGVPNQIYSISNVSEVPRLLGTGPLAESVAFHLVVSGATVLAVPVAPSQAGTVSAVVASASGTGTVTVAGAPLDAYDVTVSLTRTGAPGQAAFTYSLDGGITTSTVLAVPTSGSYAIPGTGLTLTFAGDFAAGDSYSLNTTAPTYTLDDLNTAVSTVMADARDWSIMHIVGTATPAVAAAAAGWATQMRQAYRFVRVVVEARDYANNEDDAAWQSALQTEWQGFSDVRVSPVAGYVNQVSALTGRLGRVSLGTSYVARLAQIAISEHPGFVGRGALPGVTKIYHDEQSSPGLDAAGFTTARTIIGRSGYYITNGRVKAPAGSDYQYIELCRVMDKCCTISRTAALQFLNDKVVADSAGNLSQADAARVEGYIEGQIRAQVLAPGDISAVAVTVAGINILSTRSATVALRIEPLSYLSYIHEEIGFTNPALVALTTGGTA